MRAPGARVSRYRVEAAGAVDQDANGARRSRIRRENAKGQRVRLVDSEAAICVLEVPHVARRETRGAKGDGRGGGEDEGEGEGAGGRDGGGYHEAVSLDGG
ncbi:hypothetical protein FRC09_008321, partial [Ceratobasidium sp. 395]